MTDGRRLMRVVTLAVVCSEYELYYKRYPFHDRRVETVFLQSWFMRNGKQRSEKQGVAGLADVVPVQGSISG